MWFKQVLQGNLGTSISMKQGVITIIAQRLPATLELAIFALIMAVTWGGFIALVSTAWHGTWAERAIDNFNGIMLAVPDFIWALTFVLLLGVLVPVLPISGRSDPSIDAGLTTQFYILEGLLRGKFAFVWDVLKHMLLPACALAFPLAAVIGRVLKNTMMDVMVQDYITLARIKGLSGIRILLQEALRNAAVPALALTGVQFTFLIGGTLLALLLLATAATHPEALVKLNMDSKHGAQVAGFRQAPAKLLALLLEKPEELIHVAAAQQEANKYQDLVDHPEKRGGFVAVTGLLATLILGFTWLLRQLFAAFAEGRVITADNARVLKRIGIALLVCGCLDRKSARLNSSHEIPSRMPSSA